MPQRIKNILHIIYELNFVAYLIFNYGEHAGLCLYQRGLTYPDPGGLAVPVYVLTRKINTDRSWVMWADQDQLAADRVWFQTFC